MGFGGTFLSSGWTFFCFHCGWFCRFGSFFHPRVGNSMRCVLTLHPNRASSNSVFPTLRQRTSY